MTALAATSSAGLVLLGAALFGAGLGLVQRRAALVLARRV
jgi:hypothetical protein